MESSFVLSIRVQQVVTMAPELGIGFTELKHEISIDEGITEGTVVKVLELDQVPNPGLRLDCEIMRVKGEIYWEISTYNGLQNKPSSWLFIKQKMVTLR